MREDVERLASTHGITYYSAILVCLIEDESDNTIDIAKQGDDAIENYVESLTSSEYGTDAEGNPITDINDYFYAIAGITLRELSTYMEYGVLDISKLPDVSPIFYSITAKNVIIENYKELNISVSYDNFLTDNRGAEIPYNIYDADEVMINNEDVILNVASGNPEGIYTTQLNALVEPVIYAGTFTDTVTFNASLDYVGKVYEIGETQSDYVLAIRNGNNITVVKNGEDSDGIMADFETKGNVGPFFNSGNIETLTIEEGVVNVGANAFHNLVVHDIYIADSVKIIETGAFGDCDYIQSINLGNGVETIETGAFSGSGYAPNGDASTMSLYIPASVTNIEYSAFSSLASLTDIVVSSDNKYYTSFDGVLYTKDKSQLVIYPAGKSETSFVIPNSVTSVTYGACSNSHLTYIEFSSGITEIPIYRFDYCTSLKEVTIPSSVTSIDNLAFLGCNNLDTIYGVAGSYAETWATQKGYTFIAI